MTVKTFLDFSAGVIYVAGFLATVAKFVNKLPHEFYVIENSPDCYSL